MEKNGNATVVPRLRFPQFRAAAGWNQVLGDELFDSINNRDGDAGLPILAVTQEHGAIPRNLIDYHVSVTDKSIESYKVVEKGDFIISLRSFQGGIEYSSYRGICSPAYVILRRKGRGSDAYFWHLFKSHRFIQQLTPNIEGLRDGKMISYKQFGEQLIPTPDPAEQQKIADCLTSLDELIAAQGRKMEALKTYKRGILQHLFPREGETVPRLRFPEFHDAPEWETRALSHYVSTLDAGVSVNSGDRPASNAEVGILKTSCVTNGTFDSRENKVVKESEEIRRVRVPVQAGTIIMSRMNTIALVGANAYVEHDLPNLFLPDRLWAMKPTRHGNMRFLSYILGSDQGRTFLSSLASGSSGSMKNISQSDVLAMPTSMPAPAEQQRIAFFLSNLDSQISAEAQKLDALKNHKKGLLQQLFPSTEEV